MADVLCFDGDPQDFGRFLAMVAPGFSTEDMADHLRKSPATIRRWKRNEVSPPLETVLEAMHRYTGSMAAFCAALLPLDLLPLVKEVAEQEQRGAALASAMPLATPVLHALNLDAYKRLRLHKRGFIASLLGLTKTQEQRALDALSGAGMIMLYNGKYRVLVHSTTYSGDIVRGAAVASYWTRRALTRFAHAGEAPVTTPDGRNGFAQISAPISHATAARVLEIWNRAYHEMASVMAADKGPKERIQALAFHFFDVRTTVEPGPAEPPVIS